MITELHRLHLAALVSATAANFGEIGVAHFFAGLRAGFADFGAGPARNAVQVRVPNHEVVSRVAYARAIQQVADVMCVGVFTAFFQTVVHSVQARVARVLTGMDALMHLRALMFMDVRHRRSCLVFLVSCARPASVFAPGRNGFGFRKTRRPNRRQRGLFALVHRLSAQRE